MGARRCPSETGMKRLRSQHLPWSDSTSRVVKPVLSTNFPQCSTDSLEMVPLALRVALCPRSKHQVGNGDEEAVVVRFLLILSADDLVGGGDHDLVRIMERAFDNEGLGPVEKLDYNVVEVYVG